MVRAIARAIAILESDETRTAFELGQRGASRLAIVGVHEVEKRTREQLEAREAQHLFPGRVHSKEPPAERRHAQQIEREREEAVQLGGRLLAIDVQPDLLTDRRQRVEQLRIRLADVGAEELHDPQHVVVMKDGHAERRTQSDRLGHGGARKIAVVPDVGNPRRLACIPHAAGQPGPARERHCLADLGEAIHLEPGRLPGAHTAQLAARQVHLPQSAVLPAEGRAHRLEHSGGGVRQRGGRGQRACRLVHDEPVGERMALAAGGFPRIRGRHGRRLITGRAVALDHWRLLHPNGAAMARPEFLEAATMGTADPARILIVDDDRVLRLAVARLLEAEGFSGHPGR